MDSESTPQGSSAPNLNTQNTNNITAVTTEETVIMGTAPADPTSGQSETVVLINPPKKKHTSFIIGIVILALVFLGCIGTAIWYFAIYTNPQNATFEAVNNLITAKNVSTTGHATYKVENTSSHNFYKIDLALYNVAAKLPNSTSAQLTISEVNANDEIIDDHEFSLDLGNIQMADGVIYLQVGNLMDSINKALTYSDTGKADLGYIGEALYEIAELIDNEWWQISIPDIIDTLDIDRNTARSIENFYSCMIGVANEDHSAELADLYRNHQFINSEKISATSHNLVPHSGNSYYEVSLNYINLAGFINEIPESSLTTAIFDCYNKYLDADISTSDLDEVTASNLDGFLPEDVNIYLEISNFGHKLNSIVVESSDDEYSLDINLAFEYSNFQKEITAPTSYRPITDLVTDIQEIVENAMDEYFDSFDSPYYDDEDNEDYDLPDFDNVFSENDV